MSNENGRPRGARDFKETESEKTMEGEAVRTETLRGNELLHATRAAAYIKNSAITLTLTITPPVKQA